MKDMQMSGMEEKISKTHKEPKEEDEEEEERCVEEEVGVEWGGVITGRIVESESN